MAEIGLVPEIARDGLDEATLAIVVVDDDCRCLDAGEEACRLLGAKREEILGMPLEELLIDAARDRFSHVWQAFREEGGHAGPFRIGSQDQLEVDVSVTPNVLPARHLVLLSPATSTRRRPPATASNGAPFRGPFPAPSPGPTTREREILALLAGGATDGQIAERLSLSPATVRTHVRNAKAKLGASTRAQAVALALRLRFIEPG